MSGNTMVFSAWQSWQSQGSNTAQNKGHTCTQEKDVLLPESMLTLPACVTMAVSLNFIPSSENGCEISAVCSLHTKMGG